jgi:hypothetical protein
MRTKKEGPTIILSKKIVYTVKQILKIQNYIVKEVTLPVQSLLPGSASVPAPFLPTCSSVSSFALVVALVWKAKYEVRYLLRFLVAHSGRSLGCTT